MRLFQYEWRKLASCRLLFCVLVLLLAGNACLFYNQTQNPLYLPQNSPIYQELTERYSEMEPEAALQEISRLESGLDILDFVQMLRQNQMPEFEGQSEQEAIQTMLDGSPYPMEYGAFLETYGDYLESPEKTQELRGAVQSLKEQFQYILQYPDYILSMAEKRDEMKKASIFNKPGTFAYRNIEKTPEDFKGLESLPLSPGPENVLLAISTYSAADFSIALLLLLLCIYLYSQEKEKGLYRFIRTTRLGRLPTAASKLLMLLLWTLGLCLLFYGTIIIMAAAIYDFGDLSRLIQSHSSFRGVNIPMNVLQFLIVVFLEKTVVALASALLFSVIFSFFSGIKTIAVLLGIFFGLEYAAYALLIPQSWLNPLKYLNYFAFTDAYSLFAEYYNLNLFGFPVSRIFSAACCLLLMLLLLPVLYFLLNRREWNFSFSLSRLRAKKTRPAVHGSASLLRHEWFKTFISNKGWIYVAAALTIAIYTTDTRPLAMTPDNTVYWSYAELLEGPVDEAHEEILQQEAERFFNIEQEMQQIQTDYQNQRLSENEYYTKMYELTTFDSRTEGFQKAQNQFLQLQALEQKTGRELFFVNQLKTDTVFHNTIRSFLTAALFAFLLILTLSSFYPSDYQSGMVSLLRSMKLGRERLMLYRLGYAILLSILLLTILTVPHIITTTVRFGWFDFSVPIQSIDGYGLLSWEMTVGQFLILNLVFQYLTAIVLALVILAISNLLKSQSLTILSCCTLVLFPLALNVAGLSALDWCTLTNGLMIFNGFSNHDFLENLLYNLALLAIGAACFGFTYRAYSKKRTLF